MRHALLAALIVLIAGCGSPTEPGDNTPGASSVTIDGTTITMQGNIYENHQPIIDYNNLLIAGGTLHSSSATFPPAVVVRSITVFPDGSNDRWTSSAVEVHPGVGPDASYKGFSISGPHRWEIGSRVTIRMTIAGASGTTAVLEQQGLVIGVTL